MNTIKVYQTPLPRAVALDCAFVGDRKNTLVKAHSTLNRRTLFAGGAALGTVGMLAACSGKTVVPALLRLQQRQARISQTS